MLRHAFVANVLVALGTAQSTLVSSVKSVVPESTPAASAIGASASEPCALAAQYQAGSKGLNGPITAAVAHGCLMSVPVDEENDLQLIDDLKLLLQWNTDTQRFKDLPKWVSDSRNEYIHKILTYIQYDNEPFDLYAELDAIKHAIENGTYESENDVQSSISTLLSQTGDGHIAWAADISSVFAWQSGLSLVSVSSNGQDEPEIYSYGQYSPVCCAHYDPDNILGDLSLLYYGIYNFTASPIIKIDGEDIQSYLKRLGRQLAYHDAHARYNQMFPQQAQTSLGKGEFLGNYANGVYHGPNNTYTFKVCIQIKILVSDQWHG